MSQFVLTTLAWNMSNEVKHFSTTSVSAWTCHVVLTELGDVVRYFVVRFAPVDC